MKGPWLLVTSLLLGSCTPKRIDPPEDARHRATSATAAEDVDQGGAPATPPQTIRYRFSLREDASRLDARICFEGSVPDHLAAPMGKAEPYLLEVRHRGQRLAVDGGLVSLTGLRPGACLDYAVDTAALLGKSDTWDAVTRVGDDLLLSPDWWLWAPQPRAGRPIRAQFAGPLEPSVPWPRAETGTHPYAIPESTFIWKAQAAFGRFDRRKLRLGEAAIDVTIMGEGFGERQAAVMAWLERSARATADLFGAFPVERAQVLLVPDPDRRRLFGYALRGGGPSAAMLLPTRPSQALLDEDWTAVHELIHFSLPPLPTDAAWLYEGLSTYLTAVARARAGMITDKEGWWELLDGFERGRKVGTGVSLRKESEQMHESRAYWRVYWAGAALALQMDVELHEKGHSLAEVIHQFSRARPDDSHDWNADRVVDHLVELCGSRMPARIVAEHLDAKDFPETEPLRRALGVTLDGDTVRYDDRAPKAHLRRAIMAPRR